MQAGRRLGFLISAIEKDGMDNNPKGSKTSIALVGFVAGALTVVLVFLALKACLKFRQE
jgi:hypothetical protein